MLTSLVVQASKRKQPVLHLVKARLVTAGTRHFYLLLSGSKNYFQTQCQPMQAALLLRVTSAVNSGFGSSSHAHLS